MCFTKVGISHRALSTDTVKQRENFIQAGVSPVGEALSSSRSEADCISGRKDNFRPRVLKRFAMALLFSLHTSLKKNPNTNEQWKHYNKTLE